LRIMRRPCQIAVALGNPVTSSIGRRRIDRTPAVRSVLGAAVVAVLAVLLLPARAWTQSEVDDPWAGVEEMLVTGGTTAGLLGEMTTSAIAFDASELTDIGAQDVSDLARFTPSLEINTTSATTPTFFIRGVGLNDQNSNAAGAIAIYIDDVPINAPAIQLAGLFDTASVEVLRGPQAYFDARNASGGMINTISRKPDGEFSSYLRSDIGNYDSRDFEGAIGFPIYEDVVSGRFAFRTTYRDSLIENRCGGLPAEPPDTRGETVCNESVITGGIVPSGLENDTNDIDRWGTRTQIKIAPPNAPAEMEWLLNFHTARIDQTSPLGQVIGTGSGVVPLTASRYIDPAIRAVGNRIRAEVNAQYPNLGGQESRQLTRFKTIDAVTRNIARADPFENDYDLTGKETLSQLGGFVRGDMTFGEVEVKTITSVERYDRERDGDFDFSSNPSIHTFREDDSLQLAENIGIEGELESIPVRLKGGAYVLFEYLDSDAAFRLQTSPANERTLTQSYTQDLASFGVFGSFEWDMFENVTLEAGARSNWERKDFELGIQVSRRGLAFPQGDPAEITRTWSAPTYGASLTWRMTEDVSSYFRYTRGWKSGHINASTLEVQGVDRVAAEPTVAQPEDIDAVEAGVKASLFAGVVDLNASAFYYKYTNYQVFLIVAQIGSPPQLEIINANDAQIYGIETDLKLRPFLETDFHPWLLSGLTMSMNFAWLESEFLDFSQTRTAFLPTSDPLQINIGGYDVDFTGNRLPNTPQFKLSATVEWAIDLGMLGTLTPRYDVSWQDDTFFDPSEGRSVRTFYEPNQLPEYTVGQKAWALHDFRLSYTDLSGMITISGWVRNMTNKVYKRNVADLSTAFNQINSWVGDPRTYGASMTLKF
jgi:iron complex outermembrane recepter protein